jgi:quercetin dioxygenase-like cupin family protein
MMSALIRLASKVAATLSFFFIVFGIILSCTKKEGEKQSDSSLEAPVTAGYESAIAAHAAKPIYRPSGTAPAVWGPADLYALLVTGEESNGAFFQFEAIVPEGGGPPPHIHSREDESFYLVRGSLEMLLGDRIIQANAGDFVFIPRGTVHRFKNIGKDTAIQLVTFVPAGMENYFKECFPPATDRSATPPPITEDLIRKMHEAAPKYGLEFPSLDPGKN